MTSISTHRTVLALLGLAVAGALFGALAGVTTMAAGFFALAIRDGQLTWPFTLFGSVFGFFIGGGVGAVLTPIAVFTPWRYVPIGRLFLHLTIWTMIGGAASALLFPVPDVALLGGLAGLFVAGQRQSGRCRIMRSSSQ